MPCVNAGVSAGANAGATLAVVAAIGVAIAARFVLNRGASDTATGAPTAVTCPVWADSALCVSVMTSVVIVTA